MAVVSQASCGASRLWAKESIQIEYQDKNPKKEGAKAFGKYENYKVARSVKQDVRHRLEPVAMSDPALDHAGRPVRVGMVLTSTEKNNSNQVNEILRMPPAHGCG